MAAQREFMGQLAVEAGHPIDWHGINQSDMVHACVAAYNGHSAELARIIRSTLHG